MQTGRRYLTIKELAQYGNVSQRHLRKLVRMGELKHFRVGRNTRILVNPAWFDEYVERKVAETMGNEDVKEFLREMFNA